MARPPHKPNALPTSPVTMALPRDLVEWVERKAASAGVTRSKLLAALVDRAHEAEQSRVAPTR